MPRSLKKGPFIDDHLQKKVDAMNAFRRPPGDQDVVAPVDDRPRHGGPHARGARRPQARARLHHRSDGRAQARRVRAHPDVPVPRRPRAIESTLMPETVARLRYHRVSPSKVRQVLKLIVGKDANDARRDPALHRAWCVGAGDAAPRVGDRQRRPQRQHRRGRALRVACLRRRRAHAQARPSACPRPVRTDQEAHESHHDRGGALRGRRARPPPRARGGVCRAGARSAVVAGWPPAAVAVPRPKSTTTITTRTTITTTTTTISTPRSTRPTPRSTSSRRPRPTSPKRLRLRPTTSDGDEAEIEAFEDVEAEMEADAAEEADVDLSVEADAAFEASIEDAAAEESEDTSDTETSDKEGEK